jgi:hypothetical protein
MTHDELLEKIDHNLNNEVWLYNMGEALRAIVELHKPIKDEWFNVGETICEECTREEYTQEYPCPTIQAIEKELA